MTSDTMKDQAAQNPTSLEHGFFQPRSSAMFSHSETSLLRGNESELVVIRRLQRSSAQRCSIACDFGKGRLPWKAHGEEGVDGKRFGDKERRRGEKQPDLCAPSKGIP